MDCIKCHSRGCIIQGTKETDLKWSSVDTAHKLDSYDYLKDLPQASEPFDIVEVRFKNVRRDFYKNSSGLTLKKGDIVAVEAEHGHDVGIVSLTGELVKEQIRRMKHKGEITQKIYRHARPGDILKWRESILLEHPTMIKSRQIAAGLNLNMKIGDVEYQADKSKAYFYYIADDRVDFRELIKVLKQEFRVNIKMVQIGARQEAGRIGGIGPCGRELCCSTWLADFVSVSTNSARKQELSLNPQKLAGQCSKLKCCINFEYDTYAEALTRFPRSCDRLETESGTLFFLKSDVLKGRLWYSTNPEAAVNMISFTIEEVNGIIDQNKKGVKPQVSSSAKPTQNKGPVEKDFVVEQDSLTRFDKTRKPDPRRQKNRRPKNPRRNP